MRCVLWVVGGEFGRMRAGVPGCGDGFLEEEKRDGGLGAS